MFIKEKNAKLLIFGRPLLNLLIFGGMNLTSDKPRVTYTVWLIRLIVFSAAVYNFSFQIYNVINGLAGDDLWIMNFNEHFPVFAFFYVIYSRGNKIKNFAVKISEKCVLLKLNDKTFNKMNQLSWILSIFAIVAIGNTPFFTYYQAVSASDCEPRFKSIYFGISTTSTNRAIISAASEIIYCLICLFVQLHGSFLILIICIIGECYQTVNNHFIRLANASLESMNHFQRQHYSLNNLTKEFNRLFSPAILILFCSHITQLIGTTGYVKSQQNLLSILFTQPFYVSAILWCNAILPIARVAYILLLIITMAHKLHQRVSGTGERTPQK
ncbi:hypothetical protein CHUAL_001271 [Chamberlinius hualienensis]